MKKNFLIIQIFLFAVSVFGETGKIRVGVLSGPSCVPMAYMMDKNKNIGEVSVEYEKYANPQALLPKMIKQELDIGFLPVNVAAKVFNSTNKAIICCGVTGNGNISLITTDSSVRHFEDMKGKTISVAGKGAAPDYMFQHLLAQNNISLENDGVILDYSTPNAQIPSMLLSGKFKYAVVPEPFVSVAKSKSKDVSAPLNFQKEYREFYGENETYPLTLMVVRKSFALENQELVNKFLKEYEYSYKWTIKNPMHAGKLTEKYNLGLSAYVVEKAIPDSNYTFITAKNAQKQIEQLLLIFMEYDKNTSGGVLPSDDFYYSGE